MQVYLSPQTATALEGYAVRQRRELSVVVEAAVLAFLDAEGRRRRGP